MIHLEGISGLRAEGHVIKQVCVFCSTALKIMFIAKIIIIFFIPLEYIYVTIINTYYGK